MRTVQHLPIVASIIRDQGLVVVNTPSVNYPIPVAVFFRNNIDGSIGGIWPKGNRVQDFSRLFNNVSPKVKWIARFYKLVSILGLDGLLAHGKLTVYTDVPTATYLLKQWRKD